MAGMAIAHARTKRGFMITPSFEDQMRTSTRARRAVHWLTKADQILRTVVWVTSNPGGE
jgi:hypothetical protein